MSTNESQGMTANLYCSAICHTVQHVRNPLGNNKLWSESTTTRCSSNHNPNLSSQRSMTGRMLKQDKDFR